jgi:hypothetical protein
MKTFYLVFILILISFAFNMIALPRYFNNLERKYRVRLYDCEKSDQEKIMKKEELFYDGGKCAEFLIRKCIGSGEWCESQNKKNTNFNSEECKKIREEINTIRKEKEKKCSIFTKNIFKIQKCLSPYYQKIRDLKYKLDSKFGDVCVTYHCLRCDPRKDKCFRRSHGCVKKQQVPNPNYSQKKCKIIEDGIKNIENIAEKACDFEPEVEQENEDLQQENDDLEEMMKLI